MYEWNAWELYAIREWRPNAYRIGALPHDEVADVLDRVTPDTTDFLVHLNLSRQAMFPKQRSELFAALRERGIRILNADVCDITKKHVQAECQRLGLPSTAATRGGDPDEKLILKSECNHGGLKERLLDSDTRIRLGLPPESAVLDGNLDYPVMTRSELTDHWDDDGLAIERLIENRKGLYYRAYLLQDRIVISRFVQSDSANPVQRIKGARSRDNFHYLECSRLVQSPDTDDDLSPRLKSIVASFVDGIQLDFGAMDVVEDDDDNFYVIDLNITPYWGSPGQPEMTAFLRGE
ncbi:hypothetical protein K227x_57220 [Rubripirellula lacrimiformis]|uniref:ATP-grasp domain-containing protein n=1 Tax=Rubripirellula lacrimiformis TaxID=1930273 RepID=A0A517NJJ4_9BACT|nr:hypothetical protein [Rubripirellula lacrimiformis]QDT07295.1 hypothetical protein K227x_57220 [Rubripirellula lacrimiformis]